MFSAALGAHLADMAITFPSAVELEAFYSRLAPKVGTIAEATAKALHIYTELRAYLYDALEPSESVLCQWRAHIEIFSIPNNAGRTLLHSIACLSNPVQSKRINDLFKLLAKDWEALNSLIHYLKIADPKSNTALHAPACWSNLSVLLLQDRSVWRPIVVEALLLINAEGRSALHDALVCPDNGQHAVLKQLFTLQSVHSQLLNTSSLLTHDRDDNTPLHSIAAKPDLYWILSYYEMNKDLASGWLKLNRFSVSPIEKLAAQTKLSPIRLYREGIPAGHPWLSFKLGKVLCKLLQIHGYLESREAAIGWLRPEADFNSRLKDWLALCDTFAHSSKLHSDTKQALLAHLEARPMKGKKYNRVRNALQDFKSLELALGIQAYYHVLLNLPTSPALQTTPKTTARLASFFAPSALSSIRTFKLIAAGEPTTSIELTRTPTRS